MTKLKFSDVFKDTSSNSSIMKDIQNHLDKHGGQHLVGPGKQDASGNSSIMKDIQNHFDAHRQRGEHLASPEGQAEMKKKQDIQHEILGNRANLMCQNAIGKTWGVRSKKSNTVSTVFRGVIVKCEPTDIRHRTATMVHQFRVTIRAASGIEKEFTVEALPR